MGVGGDGIGTACGPEGPSPCSGILEGSDAAAVCVDGRTGTIVLGI